MHTLGKVLAFLVVVAAIVASILTSKLIQVRNSWTLKTEAAKTKYLDLQPKIDALQTKIDSVRAEIFRSQELWGTALPNVQTAANPENGTVQLGIGSEMGIRPNMLLHGFQISGEGTSIYRGSFLVADAQPNVSILKPNFRVTPDDSKTWGAAGVWRWRNALPSGYQETFDRQITAILKNEETLRARAMTLEGQKEMLQKAVAGLKQREAELVGGDGLAKSESVGPEFREGLVAAIEQIEEDRNKVLLNVDELRRDVRKVNADIEKLKAENLESMERLPEPAPRAAVTQAK